MTLTKKFQWWFWTAKAKVKTAISITFNSLHQLSPMHQFRVCCKIKLKKNCKKKLIWMEKMKCSWQLQSKSAHHNACPLQNSHKIYHPKEEWHWQNKNEGGTELNEFLLPKYRLQRFGHLFTEGNTFFNPK